MSHGYAVGDKVVVDMPRMSFWDKVRVALWWLIRYRRWLWMKDPDFPAFNGTYTVTAVDDHSMTADYDGEGGDE